MTAPIRLTSPAQVLQSVPAMLGFVPEDSIFAILLKDVEGGRQLACSARFDVGSPSHLVLKGLKQPAKDASAFLLVAIAEDDRRAQAFADLEALELGLAGFGLETVLVLHATALAFGASWRSLDGSLSGVLDDPAFSDLNLHLMTQHGKATLANRGELAAKFAATTAVDADHISDAVLAFRKDPEGCAASVLERFNRFTVDGEPLSDLDVAEISQILTVPEYRDGLLQFGEERTVHVALAAAHVSTRLVGLPRVEALTVSSLHFYLSGEGAEAAAALEAALAEARACGWTKLPQLLALTHTAITNGFHPAQLREAFNTPVKTN